MDIQSPWVKSSDCTLKIETDQLCSIGGINLQLYEWVKKTAFFKTQLFEKSGLKPEDYLLVLGLRNEGDRCIKALELIKKLWHSYPHLGPLPFLDTLMDLQNSQIFYSEYRDHLRHSLLNLLRV